MQNANASANLPVTLQPSVRGQRGAETARRWPAKTLARFGRSTEQDGQVHITTVVVTLFGRSVMVIVVLVGSCGGPHTMLVGIAIDGVLIFGAILAASGLLAIWDRRDIGPVIQSVVLIPVAIILFFGRLGLGLLKFCRGQ